MNKTSKKREAINLLFAILCCALCILYAIVSKYYDIMSIAPALQIATSIIVVSGISMVYYDILHQM